MNIKIHHSFTLVFFCVVAGNAEAATLNATSANLKSVFASAAAGDTILLSGDFGSLSLANRSFTSLVTIDASQARFVDSLSISNVSNLKIFGGIFGSATSAMRTSRAIGISNSSKITLQSNNFIGNGAGMGATMSKVTNSSISSAKFTDFKLGFGLTSSTDVKISGNRFERMTSDGINIVDSHRVVANSNNCSDTIVGIGFHPDCIQLWSIAGNPVQSDITISKNIARGSTQGFTSFNPDDGGGLRISMTNNTVSTNRPQGIACYNCVDSIFTGNVLTTLPGSQWRTSINIIGGSNNTIADNSVGPLPTSGLAEFANDGKYLSNYPDNGIYEPLPDFVNDEFARLGANDPGAFDSAEGPQDLFIIETLSRAEAFGSSAVSAVPETATWIQIILGFGLVGAFRRLQARIGNAPTPNARPRLR